MEVKDNLRHSLQQEKLSWIPTRKQIWAKLFISAVLFASIWVMFQQDGFWAEKGKGFVRDSLTQEIRYETVATWYEDKFQGTPSFIPSFFQRKTQEVKKVDARGSKGFSLPVHGKLVSTFTASRPWLEIETSKDSLVYAMDTGRVIYKGQIEDTGTIIIIQHAHGYKSSYSLLQANTWELNDWIQAGEVISRVTVVPGQTKGKVNFSVMKDDKYINPADVLTFD